MDKIKSLCENRMKLVFVILLLLSLLMTSTVSYAGEIVPYFVGVSKHVETFEISDYGQATMLAIVKPKNATVFDGVNIRMEVMKTKDDTSVYVNSWNVSYNAVEDNFAKTATYNVPAEGGYYMKVTYKCYKNNVLIETITTESDPDTYYM